jgi:hypothetical protein
MSDLACFAGECGRWPDGASVEAQGGQRPTTQQVTAS